MTFESGNLELSQTGGGSELLHALARQHVADGKVLAVRIQVTEASAFAAAATHKRTELRILKALLAQARDTGLQETSL